MFNGQNEGQAAGKRTTLRWSRTAWLSALLQQLSAGTRKADYGADEAGLCRFTERGQKGTEKWL